MTTALHYKKSRFSSQREFHNEISDYVDFSLLPGVFFESEDNYNIHFADLTSFELWKIAQCFRDGNLLEPDGITQYNNQDEEEKPEAISWAKDHANLMMFLDQSARETGEFEDFRELMNYSFEHKETHLMEETLKEAVRLAIAYRVRLKYV